MLYIFIELFLSARYFFCNHSLLQEGITAPNQHKAMSPPSNDAPLHRRMT